MASVAPERAKLVFYYPANVSGEESTVSLKTMTASQKIVKFYLMVK